MEEDLLSTPTPTPRPAAPTDSFSHNWVLNTRAAPFEFCYISSRSDSNAAVDDDDQAASASVGSSFNFGTHLPHWHAGKVHDDDDIIYADELFLNGFMKTTDSTPPLQEKETQSMCCAVTKHPESSPSPAAAVLLGSKVLAEKWGRHTVMKLWKVLKQMLIMDRKAVGAGTRSNSKGGGSCLEPEEGKREIYGTSGSSSFYDNPIYEAVLHCKRSYGGYNNQ
uniref:Uncharacterized protein n=1 Tax=Kalanchoe fedtschenkoi TaxID=63787 RepID=A0A7N0R893_KALFE